MVEWVKGRVGGISLPWRCSAIIEEKYDWSVGCTDCKSCVVIAAVVPILKRLPLYNTRAVTASTSLILLRLIFLSGIMRSDVAYVSVNVCCTFRYTVLDCTTSHNTILHYTSRYYTIRNHTAVSSSCHRWTLSTIRFTYFHLCPPTLYSTLLHLTLIYSILSYPM